MIPGNRSGSTKIAEAENANFRRRDVARGNFLLYYFTRRRRRTETDDGVGSTSRKKERKKKIKRRKERRGAKGYTILRISCGVSLIFLPFFFLSLFPRRTLIPRSRGRRVFVPTIVRPDNGPTTRAEVSILSPSIPSLSFPL